MLKYDTVLLDLDGTLIDTNELILVSFLHVLENYFPGQYNRENVIPHMGKTLHEQMELFGGVELRDELVVAYREHNETIHDEWVREFPHVRETLEELKQLGVTMGVVTTKQRITAVMGADVCGVTPYMSTFVTFQDTERHKPSPDPVLKALENLGANPETTLMVGDTQFDIQAGHNAGVHSAGVAWSLKGAEFLQQFNPEYILQDMRDLVAIVKGEK
ncbi:pyrophosphatase PpaX [Ammoniphilus sp. CFH 90114]|uniref:pyrophosphatase PpaX n=1 Tax=Ammoniphilus sp. CFH 90114 TaxID=2493665 RepID=UPI00100FF443|nr:pyrophosphatase PpaX [Ammoniphilus sp. CFH 90114]RXT04023.1 pyrophosphatase PpaX [Ammoniphilus sp. CFH 90114]